PPRPARGEQTRGYGNGKASGRFCHLGPDLQCARRGADYRTGQDPPGGGTGDKDHQRRKTAGPGGWVHANGIGRSGKVPAVPNVQVVKAVVNCEECFSTPLSRVLEV